MLVGGNTQPRFVPCWLWTDGGSLPTAAGRGRPATPLVHICFPASRPPSASGRGQYTLNRHFSFFMPHCPLKLFCSCLAPERLPASPESILCCAHVGPSPELSKGPGGDMTCLSLPTSLWPLPRLPASWSSDGGWHGEAPRGHQVICPRCSGWTEPSRMRSVPCVPGKSPVGPLNWKPPSSPHFVLKC